MTTDLGNDPDTAPLPVLDPGPDAVAWVVPPRVAAAGPGAVASLLRASGLALPAMAVAGSIAALMVRWSRCSACRWRAAWPRP